MRPLDDRALGALTGLALGDALGMPTQTLDLATCRQMMPLPPLLLAGGDNPISGGMPAGAVTDDTDQALIVGHLVVAGDGMVDARRFADELLAWEQRMRDAGSSDLLGPSTARAVAAVRAGADPMTTGRSGTTNGGAMRIAPVGIATPGTGDLLVRRVAAACQVTHFTPLALAGAAAVAAGVSTGLDGNSLEDSLDTILGAAHAAAHLADGDALGLTEAIRHAVTVVAEARRDGDDAVRIALSEHVGTSLATEHTVPAAIAVATNYVDDPWMGLGVAGSCGDDTDTIAAIAGALLGAQVGAHALPADVVAQVLTISHLDLAPLVAQLVQLREKVAE